jgi:hypothetical protein
MQARLSLDIKYLRESSRFMRVARGRFVLRGRLNEIDGEPSAGSGRDNLSTSQSHANFARPPSQCYVRPQTDLVIFLRFKGLTEITGLLSPDY